MGFLSIDELLNKGFGQIGHNVLISDKASIYNPANIFLGNNIRIDDFCILSAGIEGIWIGDHVHIAAHASLIGAAQITIGDYAGISHKCTVLSSTDDFSGTYFSNPMCDHDKRNVTSLAVDIGINSVIGAGTVILPGGSVGNNVAVGANSLVNSILTENAIYAGVPARQIKTRKLNKFL
jgi:acetyltransferase-like isoleucine patch superfamily enzyme